jgi:hypothetical protein
MTTAATPNQALERTAAPFCDPFRRGSNALQPLAAPDTASRAPGRV